MVLASENKGISYAATQYLSLAVFPAASLAFSFGHELYAHERDAHGATLNGACRYIASGWKLSFVKPLHMTQEERRKAHESNTFESSCRHWHGTLIKLSWTHLSQSGRASHWAVLINPLHNTVIQG